MAAATVAVTPGRVSPFLNRSEVLITVTYSATNYATATGGLPFDLFSVLQQLGTPESPVNYKDIMALIPLGLTTEKFVVGGQSFAVGTATLTTLPCTVRIYGTGSANKAALTEVDDAALTGSFSAMLVIARGGAS
jgi:hypothetical protein